MSLDDFYKLEMDDILSNVWADENGNLQGYNYVVINIRYDEQKNKIVKLQTYPVHQRNILFGKYEITSKNVSDCMLLRKVTKKIETLEDLKNDKYVS